MFSVMVESLRAYLRAGISIAFFKIYNLVSFKSEMIFLESYNFGDISAAFRAANPIRCALRSKSPNKSAHITGKMEVCRKSIRGPMLKQATKHKQCYSTKKNIKCRIYSVTSPLINLYS